LRQRHPESLQSHDDVQTLELFRTVQPPALARPWRLDEPVALVDAQRAHGQPGATRTLGSTQERGFFRLEHWVIGSVGYDLRSGSSIPAGGAA
jgi:hypothetical protein